MNSLFIYAALVSFASSFHPTHKIEYYDITMSCDQVSGSCMMNQKVFPTKRCNEFKQQSQPNALKLACYDTEDGARLSVASQKLTWFTNQPAKPRAPVVSIPTAPEPEEGQVYSDEDHPKWEDVTPVN